MRKKGRVLAGGLIAGAILAAGEVTIMSNDAGGQFAEALVAREPAAGVAEAGALYARLVGDWTLRVVEHGDDGEKREYSGELLFRWILEGRATQDLWIAPPRPQRGSPISQPENLYGTTIRVYDPAQKAWRIDWINPVDGAHKKLTGRRRGDDMVHEGKSPEGHPIRWVFTDILGESFRWYGERSLDGGKSWKLEAEVFGTRRR